MKGLVLKDLYVLKGYSKQYGMIFGFMFLWSILVNSFSFMMIYFVVIGGTIVVSTAASDEAAFFNRFAMTGPIDYKDLVGAKYILFIMIGCGGSALGLIANLLLYCFRTGSRAFDMEGMPLAAALFITANAVTLPVMFKLGAEKARYIYIAIMMAMGAAVFAGEKICTMWGTSLDNVMEGFPNQGINILFLAVSVAALVISYFVSVRVVRKREW